MANTMYAQIRLPILLFCSGLARRSHSRDYDRDLRLGSSFS